MYKKKALHRAKLSQISICCGMIFYWYDANIISIKSSSNSREAWNSHKSGLILLHGMKISWRVN